MTIEIVFPEPMSTLTTAEVDAIENHPSAKGAERAVVSLAPDGQLDVAFVYGARKFERIRRITGYLVGTLDRFNDAKRAEEHDRVKHALSAPPPDVEEETADRIRAEKENE
jgi:hypothetical protein